MIEKLDNCNEETARQIYSLFQASYKIEAELLNVLNFTDFPPLNRKLNEFINCDTEFYGLWKGNEIAAIVEVETNNNNTDIHSLVVHPKYFRQGLGSKLIQFVTNTFDSEIFTVETGVKNIPALRLYLQLGFVEQEQWDTKIGIRIIKFVRTKLVL